VEPILTIYKYINIYFYSRHENPFKNCPLVWWFSGIVSACGVMGCEIESHKG
jgi:hypothetical protein